MAMYDPKHLRHGEVVEVDGDALPKRLRLTFELAVDAHNHAYRTLVCFKKRLRFEFRHHPEETALLLRSLYWDYDHILRASSLAGLLGISTKQLRTIVGTAEAMVFCAVCDKDMAVTVKTPAERLQIWNQSLLCDACKAADQKEREVRRKQWEAETANYAARLRQLKVMPYSEYLQTPEWKATRKRALKRAGFACQLCSAKINLDVHHRTYERKGEELDGDLMVLCHPCHAKFHNIGAIQ